jgi:predicted extracellular nuclease
VQYTPYVNGRTPYLGAVISLSGIMTADTAHISLSPATTGSTNAWYMQSGNQPWSGIWLTTSDIAVQGLLGAAKNGDSITVTGTVQEQFDVTRLGNITAFVPRTTGNPEPDPVVRTTNAFNVSNGVASAEAYEGMLVRFNNVTVTNLNPTYSDETEFSVSDGSGPVVVQRSGRYSYSNVAADSTLGKTILKVGTRMTSLTGIVYYSFNQYKFVPRTDADFQGVVLGVDLRREDVLPVAFGLEQNYPNPFNPSTNIRYELPTGAAVSLRVYDLLGREVATLVNETQAPGRYTVRFDGSSLSSGIYFTRLQAGTFVTMRKMLLVK